MPDPRTDQIAREAARLLESGRIDGIGQAIRKAAEKLGHRGVELPGWGRVRKHVQARSMQALGDVGYAESVRDVWRVAERLMTVLADFGEPMLAGRAAQGRIDAGVTLYVRIYTETPIGRIAETLVELGYDEPDFETVETRSGRLDRLRLEDDGLKVVVTRCLPRMARDADRDLFTGRPVKTAGLKAVRRRLES